MITLIVARSENNIIGREGGIPWTLPEDMRFFRKETMGGAVIMRRRTWESLNGRVLPGRLNIVVSSGQFDTPEDVVVCASISDAIAAASKAGYPRVYGIGGYGVYKAMLPLAHRLVITQVPVVISDGDTVFPDFDEADWKKGATYDLGGAVAVEYFAGSVG